MVKGIYIKKYVIFQLKIEMIKFINSRTISLILTN